MAVYFAIFQILPTFVYELFETMQSSVTRSRTSITKSLPASFKLSIFTLSSESYIKIHCFMPWNYWFQGMKQNGITPWWVILFMTLPCSQLCSLLRIYNPIEQETRNNWYYPNFPPSGRLRHTLNSLHFATL